MHVFSTARHRRAAVASAAAAALAALAALTGCSSSSHPAADAAATKTATKTATTPASKSPATVPATTPAMTSPAATAPATSPSPATPPAVPTLGQPAGLFAHGQGFGQVKPATVDNGGDPTGLVTAISWHSWGGSSATGTGTSDYVGPNQTVATGTQQPVTIVAFDLGDCGGRLMYRAVEWYFPQHRQSFNPRQYEDVCTGSYVPSS
jgi:hypothetical protein